MLYALLSLCLFFPDEKIRPTHSADRALAASWHSVLPRSMDSRGYPEAIDCGYGISNGERLKSVYR